MNKNRIGKGKWCILLFSLYLQIAFADGSEKQETRDKKQETRSKTDMLVLSQTLKQVQGDKSPQGKSVQEKSVQGTVRDKDGILPGVTVTVRRKETLKRVQGDNSPQGTEVQGDKTVTDDKGQFSITATKGDVLEFSFMGYKTFLLTVGNNTQVSVIMEVDAEALQEVTVNAGYYKVKEKELTGSISKISAKEIEIQPVTNVLAAMQGRMAGVFITQTTGIPGGDFAIQIRGQNSLSSGGNDPLYIIDGVPYSSESVGSFYTSSVLGGVVSPLNSINPDNIESIEVLKDADATSIYGSRGANGVVLISTKKGKAGKTQFSTNYYYGFGTVTRFMDLMDTEQYVAMRKEAYANDGVTKYPANAYDLNGKWEQNRYTDWQEELTGGTAEYTNLNASISGGSEQDQFLLSGNFAKQTTVFPGDFRYKKGNLYMSAAHESDNKKFHISFTGGYTVQDNNQPGADLTQVARRLSPNAPALYDAEGNLNWQNNTFTNPLARLNGTYSAISYDLLANSVVSYHFLDNLELKSLFGFTDLQHDETNTGPSTIYIPSYGLDSASSVLYLNNTNRQSWIVEPQLNWNKSYGKASFSALAGATFQSKTGDQIATQAIGFPSNSLIYNIAAASDVTIVQNDASEYRYQAFFGRANVNWDNKYIVNLTGRRDGSSRFGPGKQFANFGAVGAAWLFSNETFLKDNSVLSFGKLRGSYGTTGNDQIGDYQFLDTYLTTGISYEGIVGLEPSRLYNSDFGWETNKKLEIAIETGFLNDRIFATAGWYSNRSTDQLVGVPLPGTTGFSTLQANLDATVQNQGWEISLRTMNIANRYFTWSTNFTFTTSKNKLISFPNLESSTYSNKFVVGQPLDILKLYHYTGIDPQTGLYQFEDVNGDGDITEVDDMQTIKDLNPQFYGGLQNQLRYKQISLDFLFVFVKQENYSAEKSFGMPGSRSNQPATLVDRWQNINDVATFQAYSVSNGNASQAYFRYYDSDASIVDASFIRLKNIALNYDIPQQWLKKVSCRISLTGQNLLTFTNYNGADPEFKLYDRLPPLKVFTTGLQLTF